MNEIKLDAYEVINSRAQITLKVKASFGQYEGEAIVPNGASTGIFEAYEKYDEDKRLHTVIEIIKNKIEPAISKLNIHDLNFIDQVMINLDGSKNKKNFGANAILGVSMALFSLYSKVTNQPLYKAIGGTSANRLPIPMFNILNGGKHANNKIDTQEIMIVPVGAKSFKEATLMAIKIYQSLKELIIKNNFSTSLGDEGGFVLPLNNTYQCLDFLIEAINNTNLKLKEDIMIALDVAASSFYDYDKKIYNFENEEKTSEQMIDFYEELCEKYPIISIEDGLQEEDERWYELTKRLKKKIFLIGDDLFVTNNELLKKGIMNGYANGIIIKPNQIGSISETLKTIAYAKQNNYVTIVSHRSGDSEDTFIADLAVGVNSLFIKSGAPARSERCAKYNRLIEIERELNTAACFANLKDYFIK